MTETTGIYNSAWHEAVFDLFVYVLAMLRKLLSRFTTGIFTCFSGSWLAMPRSPQSPQMLRPARPRVTAALYPLKTFTWRPKSQLEKRLQERPWPTASFLLSGAKLRETQRLKSLQKKMKAPKSPLCCSTFTCSRRPVRDVIVSLGTSGGSNHKLDFYISVHVTRLK